MKKETDPDLDERLRQFERICVFQINHRRSGRLRKRTGGSLDEIGRDMFGLTHTQATYCQGRAQNFLLEVQELTRIRTRAGKPIDSDAMMSAIMERKAAA